MFSGQGAIRWWNNASEDLPLCRATAVLSHQLLKMYYLGYLLHFWCQKWVWPIEQNQSSHASLLAITVGYKGQWAQNWPQKSIFMGVYLGPPCSDKSYNPEILSKLDKQESGDLRGSSLVTEEVEMKTTGVSIVPQLRCLILSFMYDCLYWKFSSLYVWSLLTGGHRTIGSFMAIISLSSSPVGALVCHAVEGSTVPTGRYEAVELPPPASLALSPWFFIPSNPWIVNRGGNRSCWGCETREGPRTG